MLDLSGIIGKSEALTSVYSVLEKVAPTDSTVLVTGDSGTGKELLVRALHRNSKRKGKPFVAINCGAIPRELLESELFGHEKGAFTHAIRTRAGRFELADGGTIFLDEIGEMDLSLQVKILRVLQEREFEKVGGTRSQSVDVRIVAATNRDLEKEVAAGRFREDLFYRLNVIPMHLPALKERGEDVLLLASTFLKRFSELQERELELTPEVNGMLLAYTWAGNVRELENLMERLSILCDGKKVLPEDLPPKIWEVVGKQKPVVQKTASVSNQDFRLPRIEDLKGRSMKDFFEELEEAMILEALKQSNGVKNMAAELLGVKRTTLIEKMKKRNL